MRKIIVLFSGGLDSTAVLYWAKRNFDKVITFSVDYDQKHGIETKMAEKIASVAGTEHISYRLPLKNLVESALIDDHKDIPDGLADAKDQRGIPHTYVPFRNGILLSLAAALGESRHIQHIATGFNLIDTPDYPDTTAQFTQKMEDAINQGTSASVTGVSFKLHIPLIGKSKREIVEFGLTHKADFSYSVSCYRGTELPCGSCPSCEIRNAAFEELKMTDPLIKRLKEG